MIPLSHIFRQRPWKNRNLSSNNPSLTIKNILNIATQHLKRKDVPESRLTAEILLSFVLKLERQGLYLNYDKKLNKRDIKNYWSVIRRRIKGEPVQYIIEKKEFWSLEFNINPAVFIPRPETEILVEHALESIKKIKNPFVLDIGTGSGVIAIAIAKEIPDARIWAVDISDKAIETAICNAKKHKVYDRIKFLIGDLWKPLRHKNIKFHLIVTNPPYISEEDYKYLPKEIKEWEPKLALDGGTKGIRVIKRIIREAGDFLRPGGWIFIEIAPEQVDVAIELLKVTEQFQHIEGIKDYSNKFRIVKAYKT